VRRGEKHAGDSAAVLQTATDETDTSKMQQPKGSNDVMYDLRQILTNKDIKGTTKLTLVEARIGQGQFRRIVLAQWNNECAVTASKTVDAIRASHIKPWSESTDQERLDASNGIPLVASLDALFDRGMISFADSGAMLVSEQLNSEEQELFGLVDARLRQPLSERMKQFMRFHRARHGFGD
jgi:predicted restriction endonuclease